MWYIVREQEESDNWKANERDMDAWIKEGLQEGEENELKPEEVEGIVTRHLREEIYLRTQTNKLSFMVGQCKRL